MCPPACAARLNGAMRPSFAELPAAAAPANPGAAGEGAPASSGSAAARSDASASFLGSAEERRFGPDGPGAWGAPDRGLAKSGVEGRAAAQASRARFPTPRRAPRAPPEPHPGGPEGLGA